MTVVRKPTDSTVHGIAAIAASRQSRGEGSLLNEEASEREAMQLVDSDPATAEKVLSKFVERSPTELRMLRPYARALLRQDKFRSAQPIWEQIAAATPNALEPRMALARIYHREKRYGEALDCLDAVLAVQPRHPEAMRLRCKVAEDSSGHEAMRLADSDPAAAEEMLSRLVERSPAEQRLLRPYGRVLLRRDKFETAQPIWEQIAAAAPNDPEPRMALTRIHHRANRYAEALECLDAVLAMQPDHPEAKRLRRKITEEAVEAIANSIPSCDAGARDLLNGLNERIEDQLRRVAGYLRQIDSDRDRHSAASDAAGRSNNRSRENNPIELARSLSNSGQWPAYVDVMEKLVVDRSTPFAWIVEHIDVLSRLVHGEETQLSYRARRLLRLCESLRARSIEDGKPSREPGENDSALAGTEEELAAILVRLSASDIGNDPHMWSDGETEALALVARDPWLAQPFSQFLQSRGCIDKAVQVYHRLHASELDSSGWQTAVALAAAAGDAASAMQFAQRAIAVAPSPLSMIQDLAKCFTQNRFDDLLVQLWRSLPGYSRNTKARIQVVRLLYAQGADAPVLEEALAIFETIGPLIQLAGAERRYFIDVTRRVAKSALRGGLGAQLAAHEAVLGRDTPSVLRSWALGVLARAKPDIATALDHFGEALRFEPAPQDLSIPAEIALLHVRRHRYRDANEAAATIGDWKPVTSEQRAHFRRVQSIVEFCGAAASLYPECLVDAILEEISISPVRYTPKTNHVVTIVGSLDQGGSERQTVNVLGRMAADPRVSSIALAVRSADSEHEAFFLPAVREMPVKLFLYGKNWRTKAEIREHLPELENRDRLITAIELLPGGMREDVVRLARLFFDEKPQAVHIRQDLYSAGVACALAGVPQFLVHRGSLSPDLWGYNELQVEQHLRPMRHVYRRLLDRGNFLIINNSGPGRDTDLAWTSWPDTKRFAVVHNAYDFEQLGGTIEPNWELRAQLGIAKSDVVVGTAFRFVPVKRPMLWIETAYRLLERLPQAQFLILGDGPLMDGVRGYAEAHGFSGRLHLPGRISDVGAWYRAMDINLLTSEREGLPNTLIEGQHFGVPSIAAHVGGAGETLDDGVTGHLVPPDAGPDVFAAAILNAVTDSSWMANVRQRAPQFVHTKFSAQRTVDQLLHHLGIAPKMQ